MRALRVLIPPPTFIAIAILAYGYWQYNSDTQVDESLVIQIPSSSSEVTFSGSDIFRTRKPVDYQVDLTKAASRPLFIDTRRQPTVLVVREPEIEPEPVVEEEPEPEITEPDWPNFEYRGFLQSSGGFEALIVDPNTGAEYWIARGDGVTGWIVKDISEKSVVFEFGPFEHIVDIKR